MTKESTTDDSGNYTVSDCRKFCPYTMPCGKKACEVGDKKCPGADYQCHYKYRYYPEYYHYEPSYKYYTIC